MARIDVDPETWGLLNRLLDECLDLPTGDRDAWLGSLPEEHAPHRARLESLLARAAVDPNDGRFATLPKMEIARVA